MFQLSKDGSLPTLEGLNVIETFLNALWFWSIQCRVLKDIVEGGQTYSDLERT